MANNEKTQEVKDAQAVILKAIKNASSPLGSSKNVLALANAYALLEGTVKPSSKYEVED